MLHDINVRVVHFSTETTLGFLLGMKGGQIFCPALKARSQNNFFPIPTIPTNSFNYLKYMREPPHTVSHAPGYTKI
jgi:hypothetical protein